ncbi:MAG: hypothetical protein KKC75_01180 [Nanoarchaeota archaeon]|nr:hypothetical protein [Nanoarchaeota archaeon]MBU1946680.1 hypothetical protein [Nanoarchaeota archaeon]
MAECILKANDGNGMGHLRRALNLLLAAPELAQSVELIAHQGFQKFLEEFDRKFNTSLVPDCGWRLNLDTSLPYLKWNSPYAREFDQKAALDMYYLSFIDALGRNPRAKLVYVDDHNDPAAMLTGRAGKALGLTRHPIKELVPDAALAFLMQTQGYFDGCKDQMPKTRKECFDIADYLLFPSHPEFIGAAADFDFSNGNPEKVISLGFLVDQEVMGLFKQTDKRRVKNTLYGALEVDKANRKLIYCSFGAGEAADSILRAIFTAAQNQDYVFVIADPRGLLAKKAQEMYDVKLAFTCSRGTRLPTAARKISLGNGRYVYIVNPGTSELHLKYLAASDVLLQSNGSNTTYEAIAAGKPTINVHLPKPGFEQGFKALAMSANGLGEVLMLPGEADMADRFRELVGPQPEFRYEQLSAQHLEAAIGRILDTPNFYGDNLAAAQRFITSPQTASQILANMMLRKNPQEIVDTLGLPRYE